MYTSSLNSAWDIKDTQYQCIEWMNFKLYIRTVNGKSASFYRNESNLRNKYNENSTVLLNSVASDCSGPEAWYFYI